MPLKEFVVCEMCDAILVVATKLQDSEVLGCFIHMEKSREAVDV